MPAAAVPANEDERLRTLRSSGLLERPRDVRLDTIVHDIAQLFDVPVAAVTLIDQARQFFKASIGAGVPHTPRSAAFCAHTILGQAPLVVLDAAADARFADNPLVEGRHGIRFYAGAPVFSADVAMGALCVIGTAPRADITPAQLEGLCSMAREVSAILSMPAAPP